MIDKTPTGWTWELEENLGPELSIQPPLMDHHPSYRVSELLGPDGHPLRVPYPRVKMGFDLRPKAEREKG